MVFWGKILDKFRNWYFFWDKWFGFLKKGNDKKRREGLRVGWGLKENKEIIIKYNILILIIFWFKKFLGIILGDNLRNLNF